MCVFCLCLLLVFYRIQPLSFLYTISHTAIHSKQLNHTFIVWFLFCLLCNFQLMCSPPLPRLRCDNTISCIVLPENAQSLRNYCKLVVLWKSVLWRGASWTVLNTDRDTLRTKSPLTATFTFFLLVSAEWGSSSSQCKWMRPLECFWKDTEDSDCFWAGKVFIYHEEESEQGGGGGVWDRFYWGEMNEDFSWGKGSWLRWWIGGGLLSPYSVVIWSQLFHKSQPVSLV